MFFLVRWGKLAIAFHDFGKVWGEPGSPDFKVPLDLRIVSEFLDAYQEINPLEEAEIEALPISGSTTRTACGSTT